MKNYSYIGISLIILVFGIIFVPKIVDRLSDGEVVIKDRLNVRGENKPSVENLMYMEVNGEPKKVPPFKFINQQGDTITNADYKGKVYVVEFFFSTCPSICPIMNDNLVEVQNEFRDRDDFGIASFSIDPRHDTPEVLKEYAQTNDIEHPNWHLLTGEAKDIYQLANTGFNIYANENENAPGGFEHSGFFALVDKEGYFRSRQGPFGNPIIFYRGSVERGKVVMDGEEEPQIDILIEDIKKLL